jgi:hypothetical protein
MSNSIRMISYAMAMVIAGSVCSAQQVNITGMVVDSTTSGGISGATVTIAEIPQITTTTSATGAFALSGTTGTPSSRFLSPAGGTVSFDGQALRIKSMRGAKNAAIDVFEINGTLVFHAQGTFDGCGNISFANIGKNQDLATLKITVDGKTYVTQTFGLRPFNVSMTGPKATSLLKAFAAYTIQVSAATYASKSVVMSSPTGDAGTIKLAKYQEQTGVWTNVTPAGLDPTIDFGTTTIQVDPRRPSNLYAQFGSQGVFRSTDFGASFAKINVTRTMEGAGGIAIADGGAGNPPILYDGNLRGSALGQGWYPGFWKSTDGGFNWTQYPVTPLPSGRLDVYPPTVDPYDPQHLIMCGHEMDVMVQSTDGGLTWTNVSLNAGMNSSGGTSFAFFIDCGNAAATRNTWLYITQQNAGTWRTTNCGGSWTKVDNNTHPHGACQIYQAAPNGAVYMAGVYSSLGWGVLRSTDLGITWIHVGATGSQTIVFGTPNKVYAMYGWAVGTGTLDPSLEIAAQPGITGWTASATPAGMHMSGAAQVAVTYNGTHYVIVDANWTAGLWRYIE